MLNLDDLTYSDIIDLPAGVALDLLIAVEFLGWKYVPAGTEVDLPYGGGAVKQLTADRGITISDAFITPTSIRFMLPKFSQDIESAWPILLKMVELSCGVVTIEVYKNCTYIKYFMGYTWFHEKTAPLAICKSALLFLQQRRIFEKNE